MRQGAAWPSSAGELAKDNFDGEHPNRIFYPNSPVDGKQLDVVKLRMVRVGTRMPTVSRTEGQCLVP
jgi:hypothetical protein